MAKSKTPQLTVRSSKPLSRRQWLHAWLGTAVVLAFSNAATARRTHRQRRRGETAPTGWFGHC